MLEPRMIDPADVVALDDTPRGRRRGPLVVRPIVGDRYELVAGWDALEKAQRVGNSSIPALVRVNVRTSLETRLLEHQCLQTLDPIEEARLIQEIKSLRGWSQRDLERNTGIPQPHISKRLALLNLDRRTQHDVAVGEVPIEVALELART